MRILLLSLLLVLYSCGNKSNIPEIAEIWQPEIISSKLPEFATTVNAELNQVYFNRTNPDRSSLQIMQSELINGKWSNPVPLSFSNGTYRDVDPFLSHDENRLYFSSTRPRNDGDDLTNWDTWYIEKVENKWSDPINTGIPLNSDSTEIFVTLAKNRNAYFVSERDGNRGIMVSRFENGSYTEPEKVSLLLRGEPIYAGNPCISSDESFLIVALRDPEGNQTPDLFISFKNNGNWSDLKNLGTKVNDPDYADFAPGLSKDDNILFFSSERPGIIGKQAEDIRPPGDIYWVDLKRVIEEIN